MNLPQHPIDNQLFTEFQGQLVANTTHFSLRKDMQFPPHAKGFCLKK